MNDEKKIKYKKPIFICAPEKHPDCPKQACHINGGSCRLTVYEDYAATYENGQPKEAGDKDWPF